MDIDAEARRLTFDRDMAREIAALVRRAVAAERASKISGLPALLVASPQVIEYLAMFADHWGMDFYDPPEETVSAVRQIIILAVASARDLQMEDEQHS